MDSNPRVFSLTPITDLITLAGYNFKNDQIIPAIKLNSDLIVLDAYGYEATAFNYKRTSLNHDIKYVTALGHGNDDNFFVKQPMFNDKTEALFDFDYDFEVKGKIFHLCACYTGINLGSKLIKKGAEAFIGYTKRVGGVDHYSNLNQIFNCDGKIDKVLCAGKTVEEAHNEAYRSYSNAIQQLRSAGKTRAAAVFKRHRDSLCSPVTNSKYGNKDATIY